MDLVLYDYQIIMNFFSKIRVTIKSLLTQIIVYENDEHLSP